MAGKTELEFVAAMRTNPMMITEMAGGLRLLQWQSGTFNIQRIAVVFDAQNRFVKVASRYQV